jgi:hypothetical protein
MLACDHASGAAGEVYESINWPARRIFFIDRIPLMEDDCGDHSSVHNPPCDRLRALILAAFGCAAGYSVSYDTHSYYKWKPPSAAAAGVLVYGKITERGRAAPF